MKETDLTPAAGSSERSCVFAQFHSLSSDSDFPFTATVNRERWDNDAGGEYEFEVSVERLNNDLSKEAVIRDCSGSIPQIDTALRQTRSDLRYLDQRDMSSTSDAIAAVILKAEEDIRGGKSRSEVMSWDIQLSGTLKVVGYPLTDSSSDLRKGCFKKDHRSPKDLQVSFDGQTYTYKSAIADDRTITVNVQWNSSWDPKNVSLRKKLQLPDFTISVVGASEDGKIVRCKGELSVPGQDDLDPRSAKEIIVNGLAGCLPWGRDFIEKLTHGDVKHNTLQCLSRDSGTKNVQVQPTWNRPECLVSHKSHGRERMVHIQWIDLETEG